MPFKIVEEQQKFKFEVNGAVLPVAHVERWGNGVWVKCCPLCGMVHEVRGGQTSGEFAPNCIVKVTHKHVYADWLQKHPDAAKYTQVLLVDGFSPQGEKAAVRRRGRKTEPVAQSV